MRQYLERNAGSDVLGFSSSLSDQGFYLPSQVIFGSNAVEHGVNLIEEYTQNLLCISGWNPARLDPLFWELEPRGFQLRIYRVPEEPTAKHVLSIIRAAHKTSCGAILAMGGGAVLDAAKLATLILATGIDVKTLSEPRLIEIITKSKFPGVYSTIDDLAVSSGGGSVGVAQKVLLVTIPTMPCNGAELSGVSAIRIPKKLAAGSMPRPSIRADPTYSTATAGAGAIHTATDESDDAAARATTPVAPLSTKEYVTASVPHLCLIQPSLAYAATMELLHDRIVSLLATAIDIALSDPGFLPELLAWDSIRQLVPILDKAIEVSIELSDVISTNKKII
jgi:hypothetical protein